MKKSVLEERMKSLGLPDIRLEIGAPGGPAGSSAAKGGSRFGGHPDVPADFCWPVFRGTSIEDDLTAERPLAFLVQLNCKDLAAADVSHRLPDHGVLSFFYELESQPWGFNPEDRGCARVYWFEKPEELNPAEFPPDLKERYQFPELGISLQPGQSWPDWADFLALYPEAKYPDYEAFAEVQKALMPPEEIDPQNRSKLLGWANVIQDSMLAECESAARGYSTGHGIEKIPSAVWKECRSEGARRWKLLFQMDTVSHGDFELMFEDCGRLYFYIPEEDLQARRFDRVWLVLQCC